MTHLPDGSPPPGAAPSATVCSAPDEPHDEPLVEVVRDDVVESLHRGHLAVVDASGRVLAAVGDAAASCYVRSAVKPAQAAAVLAIVRESGRTLPPASVAIMAASHEGTDSQQVEAAYLLAAAGLDETALRCPAAVPGHAAADDPPTRLAHNCSGKHAGFLLAQTLLHEPTADYLNPEGTLQQRIREALDQLTEGAPAGPGVDGCGAPAWRLPVSGLALLFARAVSTSEDADEIRGCLRQVATAMRANPHLVGGQSAADTLLMRSAGGVLVKRGAEAVFAAGVPHAGPDGGAIGVAVKVSDGGQRASAPAVGEALAGLGVPVPAELRRPMVLGGGERHGVVRPAPGLTALADQLAAQVGTPQN